jgi:GT2 family glycosyltransferase
MRYYLKRIRGGISKVEILSQLLRSAEAKSRREINTGLKNAITRQQLKSNPLFGLLLPLIWPERAEQALLPISRKTLSMYLDKLKVGGLAFQHGETNDAKELAQGYLRFHLDTPQIELVNIVQDCCAVSGWAVDLVDKLAVKVRVVIGNEVHDMTSRQRGDVQKEFAHICELPLASGFSCAFKLPLGVHRMRIEVESVDNTWITVRSALLIRVPGKTPVRSRKPKLSYADWVTQESRLLHADIANITSNIDAMIDKPTFTVIIDAGQNRSGLNSTIQSLRDQLYPHWDARVISAKKGLSLPDDMPVMHDMSLADIRRDFTIVMHSGQQLARNALYEFAVAIHQQPNTDLVYADEDTFNIWGSRSRPFHKPGWSPDYLETFNYIGFVAAFRTSIARGCFHHARLYDLVLRFTERTTKVLHLPKILGHNSKIHWIGNSESAKTVADNIAALSDRMRRTGRHGVVSENTLHKGCYDIRLDLANSPLVSIVIPTAGKSVAIGDRHVDLIVNVIGQIRSLSSYKNIEIIVVDNGDLTPVQLEFLAKSKCRLITYTEPVFNIAKKLNLGASIATGEMLLLMNDDIEILTSAWIERLLEHFEKPHVGVVGAKLVYPNQQTQHVGVVQPFGNPDHVRRSFARNDAGYFFSTCGVRNFSAVTGAVMMVRTGVYREVGGYTDELAVCFNDTDFCMKVGRKGLTVVYAPRAELIHMESLSRVVELDMNELAWFHERWHPELVPDQFYNDRFLTVEPPTFVPCIN